MNSGTVFAGTDGWTSMTSGILAILITQRAFEVVQRRAASGRCHGPVNPNQTLLGPGRSLPKSSNCCSSRLQQDCRQGKAALPPRSLYPCADHEIHEVSIPPRILVGHRGL